MSGQREVTLKPGQIWREVDPRMPRHVKIIVVWSETVRIQTVYRLDRARGGPIWERVPRSRESDAKRERFNGKRGGYELVEDAP